MGDETTIASDMLSLENNSKKERKQESGGGRKKEKTVRGPPYPQPALWPRALNGERATSPQEAPPAPPTLGLSGSKAGQHCMCPPKPLRLTLGQPAMTRAC